MLVRFTEIGGGSWKHGFEDAEANLLRNICKVADGTCYRFQEGFEFYSGARPDLIPYQVSGGANKEPKD